MNKLRKILYTLMFGVCIGLYSCSSDDDMDYTNLTEEEKMHVVADVVDLGLSVKWASHNVGATAPEEFGGLYAWGDVTGLNREMKMKGDYDGRLPEMIYGKPIYDIATAKWGKSWRLPTTEELSELIGKCRWDWMETTNSEGMVSGYKVIGPNGKSIFLPASGFRWGEQIHNRYSPIYDRCLDLYDQNGKVCGYAYFHTNSGEYWSGERYKNRGPNKLHFYQGNYYEGPEFVGNPPEIDIDDSEYEGHSVRPVYVN